MGNESVVLQYYVFSSSEQELAESFAQEIQDANLLEHSISDCVPRTQTLLEHSSVGIRVVEYHSRIDGVSFFTLQEESLKRQRLPLGWLFSWMNNSIEVLQQLSSVSKTVIFHPKSLTLYRDGSVSIWDCHQESYVQHKPDVALTLGAPVYMSPEQMCTDEHSEASTVFVWAILFCELYWGRRFPCIRPIESKHIVSFSDIMESLQAVQVRI